MDFFLVEGEHFDHTMSDIVKLAGVNKATLDKILPRLIEIGLVKESRRIGPAKLYALNRENEIAKEVSRFSVSLALKFADLEETEEK